MTREQRINALPDELLARAAKELSRLEWFIEMTNANQDDAVFDLAIELERLETAQRATDHLEPIRRMA